MPAATPQVLSAGAALGQIYVVASPSRHSRSCRSGARHPRARARRHCARHHAGREPARGSSEGGAPPSAGAPALNRQGDPRRHHRRARRGQVDHHRRAWHAPHLQGPPSRRPRRRSLVRPQRRLDPGRQDAHAAAGQRCQCIRAPLSRLRHARRRRGEDAGVDADLRGRRLRRGAGRDHWHGPVGNHGRRHDRLFSWC
jgi:hypothetical protein